MAKRKKNNLVNDILKMSVLLLGVLAAVLLLLKAFKINLPLVGDLELEGLKVAFGDKDNKVEGNLLVAIAILLPVGAGVTGFVLNNELGNLVSIILFVIGIVLLFVLKVPIIGNISADLKLTAIGYISLVLQVLGILVSGYKLVVK